MNGRPRHVLRYMNLDDIAQVIEIDRLSFPLPWSARSYTFEISDNTNSHMIVLDSITEPSQNGGLLGALRRLSGQANLSRIAGYGGFWFITGEAHISTIAVHPDYRGIGLGELLLAGMLSRSIDLKAEYCVLEVRVSNAPAISLYRKYEFEIVGQRKRYYRDNNEDAYLMHLAPLDGAYQERLADRVEKLKARVNYSDMLTKLPIR